MDENIQLSDSQVPVKQLRKVNEIQNILKKLKLARKLYEKSVIISYAMHYKFIEYIFYIF